MTVTVEYRLNGYKRMSQEQKPVHAYDSSRWGGGHITAQTINFNVLQTEYNLFGSSDTFLMFPHIFHDVRYTFESYKVPLDEYF